MAKKETKPAVKKETALAAYDYGEHAGSGFENITQEDIAIPFLNILQSTSPEVKKDGIEGAEAGMFYNSVTQELSETVRFVPAIREHVFVEWVKRDNGGGLVATHAPNSDVVKAAKAASTEFGKYDHNGHDLVETFYLYGVVVDEENTPKGMAVLALTSTKISAYKKLMTRLNTFQINLKDGRRISPPMFAHTLLLSTKLEKRPKGESYNIVFNAAVENDLQKSLLDPKSPALLMGAECKKLIESGEAKPDHDSNTAVEADDGEMPF